MPRRPELAERLYLRFAAALRALGVDVATGRFGAEMAVELVNDGPFTIWLDTRRAVAAGPILPTWQNRCAQAARRGAVGDEGRPVPDRAAVRDMGDRRHDADE